MDSGRSARFIDVTSDGAPPAEAVLIRAMEPSTELSEAVPEEPEPAGSPSDPPPELPAPPSGALADGEAGEPRGAVAIAPAEASGLTPTVRPRDESQATSSAEPPRSRPRLPSSSETTSEPEREVTLEEP